MNWTEKDKDVFEYTLQDGSKKFGDPLAIRRALLLASKGLIDDWWEKLTTPLLNDDGSKNIVYFPLVVLENEGKVSDAVRQAFGLKPFDQNTGEGALDAYVLALIDHYITWYDKKKSNTPAMPISSTLSDGTQGQEIQATNNSSGCSQMPPDCGCGKPI